MSLTARILLGVLASLLVVVLAVTGHGGVAHDETGSDGRTHPCGVVTADGVTEHLGAYADRCGK